MAHVQAKAPTPVDKSELNQANGGVDVQRSSHAGRPGEPCPELLAFAGPKGDIKVPSRLLMGPGPANAHPRVLAAQSLPLLGHLHPPFLHIMDEIQEGLRYVFQTKSKYTLLISGTGHAGMEASIVNLLEPGETLLVADEGIWGQRVADMAARFGAKVVRLDPGLGKTLSLEQIKGALEEHKPAMFFTCQGESSTGLHQSLAGVGEACHAVGTLLLVDTVCSLGAVPFYMDAWGVDCVYSGSQKVLSAPPGAAPLALSERAWAKVQNRASKPTSYNWDLTLIGQYWGWHGSRFYHHTGMISTWYGMREALALVGETGLQKLWARHTALHEHLWRGLAELGLEPFVNDPASRLISVNTVKIPDGVDGLRVVKNAMDKYNVEIAAGLGPSAGKVWRVGIMGYNATLANVELVLVVFRDGLAQQGYSCK